ncbi:MAG: hypothetical protein U1A27_09475 [Phycisphaerae bacterium]
MTTLQSCAALMTLAFAFGDSDEAPEIHREETLHVSVRFPADWKPVSAEVVAKINALVAERLPQAPVHYSAAFQPGGGESLESTYILIQPFVKSTRGFSLPQMAKDMSEQSGKEIKQVQGALKDICKDIRMGEVLVDEDRRQLVLRSDSEITDGESVAGISFGVVGREGLVWVHCYAHATDFAKHLPEFQQIAAAVAYDPGFGYVPPGFFDRLSSRTGRSGRAALIGGAVGGVLYFLRGLMGRRNA